MTSPISRQTVDVESRQSGRAGFTINDHYGVPIPKDDLTVATLTLYDVRTGTSSTAGPYRTSSTARFPA